MLPFLSKEIASPFINRIMASVSINLRAAGFQQTCSYQAIKNKRTKTAEKKYIFSVQPVFACSTSQKCLTNIWKSLHFENQKKYTKPFILVIVINCNFILFKEITVLFTKKLPILCRLEQERIGSGTEYSYNPHRQFPFSLLVYSDKEFNISNINHLSAKLMEIELTHFCFEHRLAKCFRLLGLPWP